MYNSMLSYNFEKDMQEQSVRAKTGRKILHEQKKWNDGFRRKAIKGQKAARKSIMEQLAMAEKTFLHPDMYM